MKQLKELTTNEIETLFKTNKAIQSKAYELAYDYAMQCQADEYDLIKANVFDYNNDHSSFFLTTPKVYGSKAPEKVAEELDADYLNEDNAKLYRKLNLLYAKMQDAEERDEDRAEYAEMVEVCDKLAEGITAQLRSYEDYDERDALEALKDAIECGEMSDSEIDGSMVIETIKKVYR